jgi:hypothetical protein
MNGVDCLNKNKTKKNPPVKREANTLKSNHASTFYIFTGTHTGKFSVTQWKLQ